jgi:Gnt-I system high-affinity gluconate transporter
MPFLIVLAGIALLLILMIGLKLNSFLALIIVALAVGITEGMPVKDLLLSIQKGAGSTLGGLALILGFGAMLGKLVAESGAAQRISSTLIAGFGKERIRWAILLTGFIIGLPMFYTAGFVILIPLVFTIAASANLPVLYVGIPMAAALSVTHGFLPPHPGPTAIASIYKADLSLTLLYGIIITIPSILVSGIIFSNFFKNSKAAPVKIFKIRKFEEAEMPSFSLSILIALLPAILMAASALSSIFLSDGFYIKEILRFIGDPVISLLISVLFAIIGLGLMQGKNMSTLMSLITNSVEGIAMILLIIAGGGAFKQVLVDSQVGAYLGALMKDSNLSPLFLAWSIAAVLRVTLGSATVAALSAAGLVVPLIGMTSASPELLVLATGAGSLMFSHVNDAGFWIFKEYFNLTIVQTLASWSVMETIVSVMGLAGVLILEMII